MEPVLFIAGLTALHLAIVALLDAFGSTKPWPRKLGWSVVILGLPLIGAILYYRRAAPARRTVTPKAARAARRRRRGAHPSRTSEVP